jgi:hypothetical protein
MDDNLLTTETQRTQRSFIIIQSGDVDWIKDLTNF